MILRVEEFRHPKVAIKPEFELVSELDYGFLGYFAGKVVKDNCVAFDGIKEKPDMIKVKSLSAAIGTTGLCGMFTLEESNEVISFGKEEFNAIKDEGEHTADDGNFIILGSPQLGICELNLLADLLEGKKFSKHCMIFCARAIYNRATRIGLTDKIERAGGEFMCDSCTCCIH